MTNVVLALLVGTLFACGAYLVMRRGQVKLVLGLALMSHAVNLLLFGSGELRRGAVPVFADKETYLEELAAGAFADPLPQALILTAIVISFGITAFMVVLISRRDALTGSDVVPGELAHYINADDPFALQQANDIFSDASDDYDILQFELDDEYGQRAPLKDETAE